jgi:probable HAF family extracellular repeat protein
MNYLGSLGSGGVQPNSINGNGQVVGFGQVTPGQNHAFSYVAGTLSDLGTLAGYTQSYAESINTAGVIAGAAAQRSGPTEAAIYANGTWVDLGFLGFAYGVNDENEVVGQLYTSTSSPSSAFVYSAGQTRTLGTLGGTGARATAISASGEVVGDSTLAGNSLSHAFSYSDVGMTDLGTLPGYGNSYASGVNDLGQVVGYAYGTGLDDRAFLYSNGQVLDLNSLIPTNSGWVLNRAVAINNSGQIVGFGNSDRAFLLTPIALPDPASGITALLVLIGTIARPCNGHGARRGT